MFWRVSKILSCTYNIRKYMCKYCKDICCSSWYFSEIHYHPSQKTWRECVYLSANRFSMAWENGIQIPFPFFFRFRMTLKNRFEFCFLFFVFALLWKPDMNFVFLFFLFVSLWKTGFVWLVRVLLCTYDVVVSCIRNQRVFFAAIIILFVIPC